MSLKLFSQSYILELYIVVLVQKVVYSELYIIDIFLYTEIFNTKYLN